MSPRLESWDAKTHPSQIALQAYLDDLEALVRPDQLPKEGLCLELRVPHAAGARAADLDNYLFPIVRRLGHQRFKSVWGAKGWIQPELIIETAAPADANEFAEWSRVVVGCSMSSQSRTWKEHFRSQVLEQFHRLSLDGSVEVILSFVTGANRNWSALWKPTIDSLGPILGEDATSSRFHPRDDRISVLGLHHQVDPRLRHEVVVGIWSRYTDESQAAETSSEFEARARKAMEDHFGFLLPEGESSSVPKRFDCVSSDQRIVGDAKFYSLVRGVNIPPAKFSIIAEHVWLLGRTGAEHPFLVFGNDRRVPELWLRRYGHLADNVIFFFLDREGNLEELSP